MTRFWFRWLSWWCIAVGVFGAVLTGAAFAGTSGPTRSLLDLMNGSAPLVLDDPLRFSLALLGAVTLGWSITLWAAIGAADRLGPHGRPVWRLLLASVVVWYVVDSALSIATGFGPNAVSNTVLALGIVVPLVHSGVLSGAARDRHPDGRVPSTAGRAAIGT